MQFEYLIFNIVILTGPAVFGATRRFYFGNRLKDAFIAIAAVAIPFIVWDALVTNRHWVFNENYTLNFRVANLPIEEMLFFFTVPFACLFTWEMIKKFKKSSYTYLGDLMTVLSYITPLIGIILLISGKEYTGLVMLTFSLAIFADRYFQTKLAYQSGFYGYLSLIIVFTLIFNGYLTARPVVLYGEEFQLGLRIFTIPVEDFFYGVSLLYLCTVLYEKISNMSESALRRVNL